MARNGLEESTEVIVGSFLGALVVLIFGDVMIGTESYQFAEGSAGAQMVEIAPVILVALGLYAGYRSM